MNENAFPLGRQRLEQLEGFKKITAPFAGTITARHVDVGTLVSSGSGRSLRPFEQESLHAFSYRSIRRGISRAAVRTAGALDPASRTLLTELEIPNHDSALFAGMYAQVKFTLREEKRRSSFLRTPLSSGQKTLKLR